MNSNVKLTSVPIVKFLNAKDEELLRDTLKDAFNLIKNVNYTELLNVWSSAVQVELSIRKHTPEADAIDVKLDEQRKKLAEAETALSVVKQAYSEAFYHHRRTADAQATIFGTDMSEARNLVLAYLDDYENYVKAEEEKYDFFL